MNEQYHLSLAAGIGAILAALRQVNVPWQVRAMVLFSGYGVAICVGPWSAEWMQIRSDEAFTALLFFCGFYGHDLLRLLSVYLQSSTLESFLQFLKDKR